MKKRHFTGNNGMVLVADEMGPATGLPVVLLHGGGQTRGSWKNGAALLAAKGYHVTAFDARGHGESSWARDGDYSLDGLLGDLRLILDALPPRPALVGASMGGITSLALVGEAESTDVRALVLVDIAPRMDAAGAKKIGAFMTANSHGFATIEEAADAVTSYNPLRPRPKSLSGLRRNLREVDGRFYWHWDPAFLGSRRIEPALLEDRLASAARSITVPTLLIRGAKSDIMGLDEAAHVQTLIPHARFVEVAGAGHMVTGDRNDDFNEAISTFLADIDAPISKPTD